MRFTRTAVVAVAIAAALGAGPLATAQASTLAAPSPGGLSTSHVVKVMSPAKKAINCDATEVLKIGKVRTATHRPRLITVFGVIKCSRAVPTLGLTLRLFRNGTRVSAKTLANHHRKSLQGSTSRNCKGTAATYRGTADVHIVFPVGFVPRVVNVRLKSKAVRVHCFK